MPQTINVWTEKRKDDEIFRVYLREYKKRFGWIKAGKIEQEAFYSWSKQAREQKAKWMPGKSACKNLASDLKCRNHVLYDGWYIKYGRYSPAFAT